MWISVSIPWQLPISESGLFRSPVSCRAFGVCGFPSTSTLLIYPSRTPVSCKLDDGLAEQVKAAAADAGTNLSDWIRAVLRHQALVAKARRAREEEDARERIYTDEQEAALMAARRRRAITALDQQ